MPKKKYQPPAKIKYNKSHPVLSFRCTPALKAKLDQIKLMSDKTVADILKEAVKLRAPSIGAAYEKGFLAAKLKYVVTYRCGVCGKVIEISSEAEKAHARRHMEQAGWGHSACIGG